MLFLFLLLLLLLLLFFRPRGYVRTLPAASYSSWILKRRQRRIVKTRPFGCHSMPINTLIMLIHPCPFLYSHWHSYRKGKEQWIEMNSSKRDILLFLGIQEERKGNCLRTSQWYPFSDREKDSLSFDGEMRHGREGKGKRQLLFSEWRGVSSTE